MKNKILLVCLLFSHVVFGQFVAGTKMLQGDFNIQALFNGNDKAAQNNFENHYINANIGLQLARIESELQHWGFGGALSLRDDLTQSTNTNSPSSTINTNRTKQWSYSLNIFQTRLKKILPSFYGGFRYSSGLSYAITTSKNVIEQINPLNQPASVTTLFTDKGDNFGINISITSQFYYFITPKWGLSANIGYLSANFSHNSKAKAWAFNNYAGFGSVGFGLFKILQK